jgi:hypothetical protein
MPGPTNSNTGGSAPVSSSPNVIRLTRPGRSAGMHGMMGHWGIGALGDGAGGDAAEKERSRTAGPQARPKGQGPACQRRGIDEAPQRGARRSPAPSQSPSPGALRWTPANLVRPLHWHLLVHMQPVALAKDRQCPPQRSLAHAAAISVLVSHTSPAAASSPGRGTPAAEEGARFGASAKAQVASGAYVSGRAPLM